MVTIKLQKRRIINVFNFVGGSPNHIEYYENFDLDSLKTPIKPTVLQNLLIETNYDLDKTKFLVQGFTHGFDLHYQGKQEVKMTSRNLKFRVGNKIDLWNKVMAEVKAGRYAGPFPQPPFEYYIQSPIGLVPKDKTKTRLIFHLSHPRNTGL